MEKSQGRTCTCTGRGIRWRSFPACEVVVLDEQRPACRGSYSVTTPLAGEERDSYSVEAKRRRYAYSERRRRDPGITQRDAREIEYEYEYRSRRSLSTSTSRRTGRGPDQNQPVVLTPRGAGPHTGSVRVPAGCGCHAKERGKCQRRLRRNCKRKSEGSSASSPMR